MKSSQDTIKKLKEDVSKGMIKISKLELELQNKNHENSDLIN